jgi:NitT/TauT family transport system permease protein
MGEDRPLTPALSAARPKGMLDWRARWALPMILVGAIPIIAVSGSSQIDAILGDLPFATFSLGASFIRMVLAYAMSLAFALGYGYVCAVNRTAERVMIPVLDILQSIPILGFLPIVIVTFIALSPHTIIGPNLASIFLIFTSMSWNMAFGVYESLKGLPGDLKEASDSFGVTGGQRVRRLILPATVNRLVYNSVLSWTAGWYFLVAAEIISTSSTAIPLTGIGTYLLNASSPFNADRLIAGVIALVTLIALLDILVWRNLGHWAERYRMDTSPSGEAIEARAGGAAAASLRRVRNVVGRGISSGAAIVLAPVRVLGTVTGLSPTLRHGGPGHRHRRTFGSNAIRYGLIGAVLVICWLLLITLGVSVFNIFHQPIPPLIRAQILTIPLALVFSMGRVGAAYLLSLGASLALALFLARRPKAARVGLPIVQIVASVPATALFPLFLFGLVGVIGKEPAVIFVELTGMIWYLFFNILSGLRSIPPDMEEAARSYGLKGMLYYRKLVFPAIYSSFVTGSITAFGGGWNTLIIAEYLTAGPHTVQVLGLGELIDLGAPTSIGEAGGLVLMTAALVTMVIAVVAVNQLLWKPLYRRASERYRYD